MTKLINAFPLYNFLKYCKLENEGNKILDCGAGGNNPPLSLFKEYNYEVHGIELSESQIKLAKIYEMNNNVELNIIKGDMKNITFECNYFDYLYTYNTSVHIGKSDFSTAVDEFKRVVKPSGLIYINFLNKECDTYGIGKEVSEGEFLDENELFVHYSKEELEVLLEGFEIIYEEERYINRIVNGNKIRSGFYDYILRNNVENL